VQSLETRDCPAAPVISAFTVQQTTDGSHAQIIGVIQDEHPDTVSLSFSGSTSGSATPDATGLFTALVPLTSTFAMATVTATDSASLTTTASTRPTHAAMTPTLGQAPVLSISLDHWSQRQVTIHGHVSDDSPGGLTVVFSGSVTGSAVTNSDGSFSFQAEANSLGLVEAVTVDGQGLQSNIATLVLTNAPPVITDFSITHSDLGSGWWEIKLTVTDESPGFMPVTIWYPNGSVLLSTTTCSTGELDTDVQLASGISGAFTAQATDWWGAKSNVASYYLDT
jgi:hypothetical protein